MEYILKRSSRRSISIRIDRRGVILVSAPFLIPKFLINKFVQDKQNWIQKQLHLVKQFQTKRGTIIDGDIFPYLGNDLPIQIGNFKTISVTKTLNYPQFLQFRIKKELTDWYKSQARKIISQRVFHYAASMNVSFKSILFSDTSSKWGSCTADNALQFNWRLIMSPLLVIDYVVVHELVHTYEKNHGIRFWKSVAKYKPAYKQYIKWLRINSHRIQNVNLELS